MNSEPSLPESITPELESLLKGLLSKTVSMRLGSKHCGGVEAIQSHPWFNGLDWAQLESEFLQDCWLCD